MKQWEILPHEKQLREQAVGRAVSPDNSLPPRLRLHQRQLHRKATGVLVWVA